MNRVLPMATRFGVWMMPAILLFLCLLSYGLLVPRLGFYWDDWPGIWVSHSLGPSGLREYAATDRPFTGWLHTLTTSLLGETPLYWQALALLTRWLTAVATWWALRGVWPQSTHGVIYVALLFAVYPGFTQQPIAWTYSHYAFIPLTFSMFSVGAMIWALRIPRWSWLFTLLAVPSSVFSMLITELFVGLELLRPAFLWLVVGERTTSTRERLRWTLRTWSPYLATLGAFLIWRLFLFKSIRPATDQSVFVSQFIANPIRQSVKRLSIALTDVIESSLMVWGQTFEPGIFTYSRVGWGLVFISALAVTLYLVRLNSDVATQDVVLVDPAAPWAKRAIVVGLLAIAAGELPVWFAARQIRLDDSYDRYTLPAMLGACLVLAGLIQAIIRTRLQQILIVGTLVGLAVGFHFRNAQDYRQNWLDQKSLLWQLSWRAPALSPGTAVLMRRTELASNDYALAAPLNFLYAPQHSSAKMKYWFFHLSEELIAASRNPGILAPSRLGSETHLQRTLRSLSFTGSTSNILVIRFSPPSCLRVLDSSHDGLPQLHPVERAVLNVSQAGRIEVATQSRARALTQILGPEPEHGWCYYFQRADLARQIEDWEQVVRTGDEVRRLGLGPKDGSEWLPFVEGYAKVERYEDAREIARLALEAMPDLQPALRKLQKKLGAAAPLLE